MVQKNPRDIVLGHEDSGSRVPFRGAKVWVRLPVKSGTAFRWNVEENTVLSKYGLSAVVDLQETPGGEQVQEFCFFPYKTGTSTLVFRLSRSFDDQIVETKRFSVEVKEEADPGASGQ